MAVSANVLRVSTTLRLGERVLVRCDDGLLLAEYVLFDATDIILRATDPVTVRETGYISTARDALPRLAKAGVTPELAAEAARALLPEVAATFARGGALAGAAATIAQIGACELFDGAVYRSQSQTYEGAWLDLRALAAALQLPGASLVLQALHLAAALDEVPRSTPIHLATANATRDRRPGERTHRRVAFDGSPGPREIVDALARLPPNPRRAEPDPQRSRLVRDALLARVHERASADAGPNLRAHLARIESALVAPDGPSAGPLSDPELQAIEQQLAGGDANGVRERLDELETRLGASPALRYLRARAGLVVGDEPPSSVAQVMSAIANEDRGFHAAELGAARTWLAAGEDGYARHFARRLADDLTARESERLIALEILDATSTGARTQPPPPVAPGLSDVPAPPGLSYGAPAPYGSPTGTVGNATNAAPPPGASLPPMQVESVPPRPARTDVAPVRYDAELVESLVLPLGATEEGLAVGDWPTTTLQARIAMIRLARSLARDYRLWYGTTLRCNVLAVDAMQRHLAQRYSHAVLTDSKVISELQRHGALLSEILARSLGADWVDIAPTEPGYWAMVVPPGTRCWPIGRVYRFVSMGHRERDLVSFFLEIETRAKS